MLLPCEVFVKCLLPPVRAIIAKTLVTKYDLTQLKAAGLLGISQPTISLYNRKMRGKALNLENDSEAMRLVENFADALAVNGLRSKDFIKKFCDLCKAACAKGLLCPIHKGLVPALSIEKCELCLASDRLKCI